jgi:predicted nucleic acid-binding protein
LVDTNVYSQAMRGTPEAVAALRTSDRLLICPIVLGELRNGFGRGTREADNLESLRRFLRSPRVEPVSITPDTAEHYAATLTRLQANGTPIPTNDIWIAACALEHGAKLATYDRHFAQVEGLLLVQL